MRTLLLSGLLFCCALTGYSQSAPISSGEYYIDTDPGPGNGTAITLTTADNISETMSIPTSSLSSGYHRLYIRYMNTAGMWGNTVSTQLFKVFALADTNNEIVTGEYFVDTDPGPGNGTVISVPAGDSISNNLSVATDGYSAGLHRFYIRYKSANGKWGNTTSKFFIVTNADTAIISGEYFVDTDPGPGNGTAIAATGGDSVLNNVSIATSGLSYGLHSVYARYLTRKGKWGSTASTLICTLPAVAGVSTICTGTPTTLSDAATGGTWSSGNTSVATIDSVAGTVTSMATGTTTITYTYSAGCSITATINVISSPGPITGVNTVCAGSTITLSDAGGGTWGTSSADAAGVNSSGVVTGVSAGVVTISYTLPCGIATANVTVNAAPTAITGATTICAGAATILSNGTTGGAWSSDNTGVATVNNAGIVLGVSAGTATISNTLTCGVSSAVVSVNPSPSSSFVIKSIFAGSLPAGLGVDAHNNIYVSAGNLVQKIDAVTGIVTTIAGGGSSGLGDGGPATAATLNFPAGIAIDASNNIYVAEGGNYRVRKITPSGIITTVAGTGTAGYSGDSGPATAAQLSTPWGLAVDGTGNLYIADYNNSVIRKVDHSGIITTYAGGGSNPGDGEPATAASLSYTFGVAVDNIGNLYITDQYTYKLRKVDVSGIITTVAGNGTPGYSGDGGPATSAQIEGSGGPFYGSGIAVDANNNLYLADLYNQRVRKIDNAGIITTIAGNGTEGYSGDGGSPVAAELNNPYGVAADYAGNIYIADTYNGRVREIGLPGITGASTVCAGSTTSLTDIVTGGLWSSGNTGIAIVNSSGVVTGVSAGSTVISYTVANSCGSASATINITVNPLPTAITGITSICAGLTNFTTTLSDGISGGIWSSSNTAFVTIGATGVVTSVFSGTVTVSYTLSCGTATTIVSVNALGFSAGPNVAICSGSSTTLSENSGLIAFTWSPAAGLSCTNCANPIASPTVTTTYLLTGTDAMGCSSTAITTVTVNPLPAAPAASVVNNCGSSTLTATGTGIIWSDGGTGSPHTVSVAGSYTATQTVGSCTSAASSSVTTAPIAMPSAGTIAGSLIVCAGATTALSDPTGSGTWSSGAAGIATVGSTGIVRGVAPGAATINYTVANTCGTVAISKVVTVNPLPSAGTVSGASSVNVGASVTLTDGASGGTWSVSNTDATVAGGVVTGVTAGTVIVSYSVSNACGTAIATMGLTITSVASPGITGTKTVCVGATTTLSDASAGGVWSSSNTHIATVGVGTAGSPSTATVKGVSAGTATITYTVSGSHITAIVTVNPDPTISVTPGTILCYDGTTFVMVSGACETGVLTGIGTFTVSAGIHTYTVTDTKGCSATASISVTQPTAINVSGTVTNVSCYGGDNGIISTSVSGGTSPYTYHWSTGATTANITGRTAGTYSLTVTDHKGCAKTVSFTIAQPAPLGIAAAITNASCYGCSDGSINLTVSSGTPAYGYVWSNGCHDSGPTGLCAGTYSVTVTDGHGCAVAGCYNVTQPSKTKGKGGSRISGDPTGGGMDETIQVYPNPNQGTFTMNLQSEYSDRVQVIITDVAGQKVKEFTTVTNTNTDITMDKAPGIYFLSAISPHGQYAVKLVIAQ